MTKNNIIALLITIFSLTSISAAETPGYRGILLGEQKAPVENKIKKLFPNHKKKSFNKSSNEGSCISIDVPLKYSNIGQIKPRLEFHFDINGILEKIKVPLTISRKEHESLMEHISKRYAATCVTKYIAWNFWEFGNYKISLTKFKAGKTTLLIYDMKRKTINTSDY